MLLEALVGGLMIGLCVSYCLLRFFDNVPTTNPISKSVIVSFIALISVTLLIEVPAKLHMTTSDALRYFLIGAVFNILRILALGIAIGYFYKEIHDE
jgi:NhaP-type Na+/H+ or K+/H+ antiporter